MIARLRDETKDMDLAIETLNGQLKAVTAQQEVAALTLHQAASQRTRAIALAHTLTRHLDMGRVQRRAKLARVDETLAEQHARLKAYDEREQRRLNLSSMPRVRVVMDVVGGAAFACPRVPLAEMLHRPPHHHCRATWTRMARTD